MESELRERKKDIDVKYMSMSVLVGAHTKVLLVYVKQQQHTLRISRLDPTYEQMKK